MTLLFQCHINFEISQSDETIKYLYKYLHKGLDAVCHTKVPNEMKDCPDETLKYESGRVISTEYASWKFFKNEMSNHDPAVTR